MRAKLNPKNKFEYLRVLQGWTPWGGWEDLTQAEDTWAGRKDIRENLKAYRQNAPEMRYRVISRREKKVLESF